MVTLVQKMFRAVASPSRSPARHKSLPDNTSKAGRSLRGEGGMEFNIALLIQSGKSKVKPL
jgi:hypothetical protein